MLFKIFGDVGIQFNVLLVRLVFVELKGNHLSLGQEHRVFSYRLNPGSANLCILFKILHLLMEIDQDIWVLSLLLNNDGLRLRAVVLDDIILNSYLAASPTNDGAFNSCSWRILEQWLFDLFLHLSLNLNFKYTLLPK